MYIGVQDLEARPRTALRAMEMSWNTCCSGLPLWGCFFPLLLSSWGGAWWERACRRAFFCVAGNLDGYVDGVLSSPEIHGQP